MKTKLLLYCTKRKPYLINNYNNGWSLENQEYVNYLNEFGHNLKNEILGNGKIVAECECEVEEITTKDWNCLLERTILKCACLTENELFSYLNLDNNNKPFYALHLTNIKMFEKPVELSEVEYMKKYKNCSCCPYGYGNNGDEHCHCNTCEELKPLTKAPQNMMQVLCNGEIYTLVSIRPEWLCKILNGEKTIEVRRKIIKGMM